ncbi:3-oxo-tetronate kinase [Pseudactinotalea terrae]|uniref:3-oxo-tetronate kinase n=1 Tax=Pseudactinotalea terrae TaxID=1743262 RepID=UPI0019D6721A|nr:3-oxo-tetronate kinase [Pseudactinotalea terrae]
MTLRYGAIADDFTGATDLAGNWRSRGLRVGVLIGLPDGAAIEAARDLDAVVIALKIRSAPVTEAVEQARAALGVLRELGARQVYQKYCSTFDSTPAGNIGPIADMLLEELRAPVAVVVPAFPDNGRTTYRGHLFVGDELLQDSPMKDHPLTPMRDSHLVRLLQSQAAHRVGMIALPIVRAGADELRRQLEAADERGERLVVVDAVENADLAVIAEATADHPLVTGGSGLALGAPRGSAEVAPIPTVPGRRAILAGSASTATRAQIEHAQQHYRSERMQVERLSTGAAAEVDRLATWATASWDQHPDQPVLIYSVGSAADLAVANDGTTDLIESAFAALAVRLKELGCRQLVVAGGETSGSVVDGLGLGMLELGERLSPGISWLHGRSTDGQEYNLVLKSGNFGTIDLFTSAWEAL